MSSKILSAGAAISRLALTTVSSHDPIQQHLDSDKLTGHSRLLNLPLSRLRTGGGMTAPITTSVRAGDRDRERTANQLGQALAQGYLAMDEYEARLQATFAAHTTVELRQLVADLPLTRLRRNDPQRAGRATARSHGLACGFTSAHTSRWSSSCSRCGWRSASRQALGTSGRSGRSSARASAWPPTRSPFASRFLGYVTHVQRSTAAAISAESGSRSLAHAT